MEPSKTIKRACIYFIYDADGIVDNYILYQLEDMRKNVDYLHCVVNGTLEEKSKHAVLQKVDELYERENVGNDIGAYKAAITYIGWEKLSEYDELILMNFTCFGPIYPFREVFDWAQRQSVDFWGLTWGEKADWIGDTNYYHYNKKQYHIQSYFFAIRKPLLGSPFLKEFFDRIPNNPKYYESGQYFEYAFPGYFEDHGYHGAVYCDDRADMNYPLLHNPVHLLEKYRMPLIKKRSFFHHYTDTLRNTGGEATARLIDFIQAKTDYDMNLIWQSVLRTKSLSDLVRCAQLNRVLSDEMTTHSNTSLRVGAIYHAYYPDLFDEDIRYIKNFPKYVDVLITTTSEEKKISIEAKLEKVQLNAQVSVVENRGRDVSALLVGGADFIKKHDIICFVHDKKSSQIKPDSIGRSWAYKLHENVLGSQEYIENVIAMFEEEERLGIAFPSPPNHGDYPYTLGTGWGGNYMNTKMLMQSLDIKSKIDERTLCVCPLGTCFWFRTKALEKLYTGLQGDGWQYSDFPREPNQYDMTILHAIERAYAYFAQDAGYYPVYIYNSRYTRIELTNLEFMKTGSTEMRGWIEVMATDSMGTEENIKDNVNGSDVTYEDVYINYGVKRSLIHLAVAIRCRYPKLWSIILPIRRIGKRILKIKTR